MIEFRFVTRSDRIGQKFSLKFSRKTMTGARKVARKLLGPSVKLDPDGYAVGANGYCLFFKGATFEELFGG